ncbi:MAG: hypothetical protein R6W96_04330 [Clostridia bacterium]
MRITTSHPVVHEACRIALSDIQSNIREHRSGLLETPRPVIMAGGDYDTPWTRDASINVYNCLCYDQREVSRDTLLSVMEKREDGKTYIGGQYWDSIIFALGAQRYVQATGDEGFLSLALEAVENSLLFFEETEYSMDYGLFRGPAVYGDGVSAYPPEYGDAGKSGFILDFTRAHPGKKIPVGQGMPMHALSTNCVYADAYRFLHEHTGREEFMEKRLRLEKAIRDNFLDGGRLKYLTGKYGDFYEQEGLGVALGLKFCILPDTVLDHVHVSPNGIPCVHPSYARYAKGTDVGRHSGTVWPFIQCFYANELARRNLWERFAFEFFTLARNAARDGQFYEIYHPDTGLPYGGLQEYYFRDKPMAVTRSCRRQTWNATGFLSMVLYSIAGMRHTEDSLVFSPRLPKGMRDIRIQGILYRGAVIDLQITECESAGTPGEGIVSRQAKGDIAIRIEVERSPE